MLFRVIFFLFLAVLPCSQAWSAPTQQRFNDWLVTCNNQNFCVTRNVGLHHGLVMTLSRSAGAVTDASLRIELGGTGNPVATLAPIAPRLLLDGKPLSLTDKRWHIEDKLIKTADSVTIDAFLQQVQEGKALSLANGLQTISLQGLKAALFFIDDRQKRVGSETAWVGKGEEPPLSVRRRWRGICEHHPSGILRSSIFHIWKTALRFPLFFISFAGMILHAIRGDNQAIRSPALSSPERPCTARNAPFLRIRLI